MRMLCLLTILGFLFIAANKSADETIEEATLTVAEKSRVLVKNFLDRPTDRNETSSNSRNVPALPIIERPRKTVQPPEQTIKTQKPKFRAAPQKETKTREYTPLTSKTSGTTPKTKIDIPGAQTTAMRTPIKKVEPKKKAVANTITGKTPPSLPKPTAVQKRPVPAKAVPSVPENATRIAILKKRERKLYDDASRILMSIK